MIRRVLPLLALLLCLVLPACSEAKKPSAPAPEDTTPGVPAAPGVTKPSEAVMARIESVYQSAKVMAEKAYELRRKGEELERATGMQGAKATYKEAQELYREAMGMLEEEIEPELNPSISEAQAEKYLAVYRRAFGDWAKERSAMGKIPD